MRRASVSLRFTGATLQPSQVTDLLEARPTLAYARGETFVAGRTAMQRVASTGLWFLDVSAPPRSNDLRAPTDRAIALLGGSRGDPEKSAAIGNFLLSESVRLDVSVRWYGNFGEAHPTIDPSLEGVVGVVGGYLTIDIDQDTEDDLERDAHVIA